MIDEDPRPPAHAPVAFTARPSSRDIIVNAMGLVRRSPVALVFGSFFTVLGAIGLVAGDRLGSLLTVAFGLSFLSGVMIVPVVWWSIRRRRDLVLAPIDVEADDAGIRIIASYGTSQHAWSVYRHARETSLAFLLDIGTGASALVTKREVAIQDVEAFRALLRRVGLLVPTSGVRSAIRPLLWVVAGALVAVVLTVGPRFVGSIGATARMDFATVADGTLATVTGTADLPDGARIGVQLLQLDEWERASDDGAQPDIESWPWVAYDDVVVHDGRFSTTLDIAGWPRGRGLAIGYFWVDASQPAAVIERFGLSAADLKGPDVIDDDVYGRMLEVQEAFELP